MSHSEFNSKFGVNWHIMMKAFEHTVYCLDHSVSRLVQAGLDSLGRSAHLWQDAQSLSIEANFCRRARLGATCSSRHRVTHAKRKPATLGIQSCVTLER